MHRFLCKLLVLFSVFALLSCGGNSEPAADGDNELDLNDYFDRFSDGDESKGESSEEEAETDASPDGDLDADREFSESEKTDGDPDGDAEFSESENSDGDAEPFENEYDADDCGAHGSYNGETMSCECDTGFDPAFNCRECANGYGPAYPVCDPSPVISRLKVDCSETYDICFAGGANTYPVTFQVQYADGCTAELEVIVGYGTTGSTSAVVLDGTDGSFEYTTGSQGGNTVRITVICTGSGGSDSAYKDVEML